MSRNGFKFDLNRLSQLREELPKEASHALARFTKQLGHYETRVRGLVKEFDSKSQLAREAGLEKVDQLSKQLKKTRKEVEKKVVGLVNEEKEKIQVRVNDLVDYLRRVAKVEGSAKKSAVKKTKGSATRSKKTTVRKPRAKRVAQNSDTRAGLPSA